MKTAHQPANTAISSGTPVEGRPRIAVLGAGAMGEAVIRGLLGAGVRADRLTAGVRREARAEELRATYGIAATDAADAVDGASVLFLAVKPHHVDELMSEVVPRIAESASVVSLVAGVSLSRLSALLPASVAAFRVMPNTAVSIGRGVLGVSAPVAVDARQTEEVVALLELMGHVSWIDEGHQSALTAVSGSGPAYVFYLAEAMVDGGVAAGLSEDLAAELTIQTLLGAAHLLARPDARADGLRRSVTSAGGTTAAALAVLDGGGVSQALVDAVVAAAARSKELATG